MRASTWNFRLKGADYYPWQQNLFREDPYHISDGHATVTDAPGWGVEINSSWLADSILSNQRVRKLTELVSVFMLVPYRFAACFRLNP